jgi:hypothetical protein
MNWEEIADKYPKAFELLCNSLGVLDEYYSELLEEYRTKFNQFIDEISSPEGSWDDRKLFDFFDENGIVIIGGILFDAFDARECEWDYEIYQTKEDYVESGKGFKSRKESESAAFTKAFEILEDKLS